MLNSTIVSILILLFIYVAVFTVYFSIIVFANLFEKKKDGLDEEPVNKQYKNLVVVIYSHNNENTIVNLLEQLNKQDYPKGNYQTHIILDNCSDNSSNKLEFVGGAKLWRLTDDSPVGKDKAVSWLLENLMSFRSVDGYVFLNANRIIKNDFLMCVNDELHKHEVVVGSTEVFFEDADFYEKSWTYVNEYNSKIMKSGRSKLGLAIPIDSDVLAIRNEVLEKIQCIDFKNKNTELKYSFLLASVNYIPIFSNKVKTYVSSIDYQFFKPTFRFKMSLFVHCFNMKMFSNFKFTEFLFSLLKPNPIIMMLILGILIYYSKDYYLLFDLPWIIALSMILLISFGVSIYKSDLYYKPIIYLAVSPFLSILETLNEIALFKNSKKKRKSKKNNIEKITVPVNVTNGRNVFRCAIDLISDEGFKKAIFRYKNKKQETTQSFVRMCDAVKNISDILEQHGFRMKICQACAYFAPKIDGTNNMVKGYCNKNAVDNPNCGESPETLIWSTCDNFIPEEVNKVIDIADFIKNR